MTEKSVYRGGREAAHSLGAFLAEREIEARVSDDPNVFAWFVSFGTYVFEVFVPADAEPAARAAIEDWNAHHAPRARALAGRLRRIFAWSALAPAAWLVLYTADPASIPPPGLWTGILWLLALVLVAQLEHRTAQRGRS